MTTVQVKQLEEENLRLRDQVRQAQRPQNRPPAIDHSEVERAPSGAPSITCAAASNGVRSIVPGEEHQELVQKYNRLKKRYVELGSTLARYQKAEKTYRAAKQRVKEWQIYIDAKSDGRSVSRPPDLTELEVDEETTPCARGPAIRKDQNAVPADQRDKHSDASRPPSRPPSNGSSSETLSQARASCYSRRVTSSQTTEGEMEPPESVNMEQEQESDDKPILVSVKSVGRKRRSSEHAMPPPRRIKQENGTQAEPVIMNSDDFSSPMASIKKPRRIARTETSDLDAIGETIDTPRKRKPFREMIRRERKDCARPPRQQVSSQPGLGAQLDVEMLDMSDHNQQSASTKALFRTHSFSDGDLPVNLGVSDELQPIIKSEQGEMHGFEDGNMPSAALSRQELRRRPAAIRKHGNALRPRSTNIPTLPHTSTFRVEKKRRLVTEKDAEKVAFLSEDGDPDTSRVIVKAEDVAGHATTKDSVRRRLGTLLEEPSPDRRPISGRRSYPLPTTPNVISAPAEPAPAEDRRVSGFKRSPIKRSPMARPSVVKTPAKKSPAVSKLGTSRLPRGLEDSPGPVRPEDESLRARPLIRLTLDDFKINKKYQQTDFAFADTIRGRDQRRSLPGRGSDFTKAIQIGGVPSAGRSRGIFESSQSSADEDAEALQDYFGPNYANIMASYGPDRRQECLLKARASLFANQHGKQRQAFQRRSTPPGFWRTDMPTTQEDVADRVEAQKLEREKVEERWLEAMREGGRWVFRDE